MSQQIERLLRRLVADTIEAKHAQGHDVGAVQGALTGAKDLTALLSLADALRDVPLRVDWPYEEPDDLPGIQASGDAEWSAASQLPYDDETTRDRVTAAFLGSVTGCVLGKPVEVQAGSSELLAAATASGESWPIRDYITEAFLDALGRRARGWAEATRGQISYVPADDDVNLRILAMVLLERRGRAFEGADLVELWSQTLPFEWVWASNRTLLLKAALRWWRPGDDPLGPMPLDGWVTTLNPYDEDCGAVIRVDPYALASPGRPGEAATLAWRDAAVTHRRSGVYGAMFQAAALAAAFSVDDPIDIFRTAIRFVPRRSRFRERLDLAIEIVAGAPDWQSGYDALELALGTWGHCRLYFELGTVINSVRFAENIGHGIGIQISQGLDTDSFGACTGAILGARFGMAGLEPRWLEPFGDDLRSTVAGFGERSLRAVAARMAALPTIGQHGNGRAAYAPDP